MGSLRSSNSDFGRIIPSWNITGIEDLMIFKKFKICVANTYQKNILYWEPGEKSVSDRHTCTFV